MCVNGDRDTQSVNTLQRALRAGKNHIADMLLSHGAYADNVTVDGTTPLHDAVIKVRTSMHIRVHAWGANVHWGGEMHRKWKE